MYYNLATSSFVAATVLSEKPSVKTTADHLKRMRIENRACIYSCVFSLFFSLSVKITNPKHTRERTENNASGFIHSKWFLIRHKANNGCTQYSPASSRVLFVFVLWCIEIIQIKPFKWKTQMKTNQFNQNLYPFHFVFLCFSMRAKKTKGRFDIN